MIEPSKEAIQAAYEAYEPHGNVMADALRAAYAIDFGQLQAERDQLRQQVKDLTWAGTQTDAIAAQSEQIKQLRLALQEADEGKAYLTRLFQQLAPQCEPLPTLSGLATQIDNYIAGLRESRPSKLFDELRAAKLALQESQQRVKELEELFSEDVAPFKQDDGLSWKETLEDGTRIPVLRGSPKLASFIAMLHQAAAAREQVIQELAEALRQCADGCEHDGYDMSEARVALASASPWLRIKAEEQAE